MHSTIQTIITTTTRTMETVSVKHDDTSERSGNLVGPAIEVALDCRLVRTEESLGKRQRGQIHWGGGGGGVE